MLIFNFLEKGLELAPPPHFCMIFQEKCFSCYILLTEQISLGNKCTEFVHVSGYGVITFEINLSILIKPFST